MKLNHIPTVTTLKGVLLSAVWQVDKLFVCYLCYRMRSGHRQLWGDHLRVTRDMHKTFSPTRIHPSPDIMPSCLPFIIYCSLVNFFLYPRIAIINHVGRKRRRKELGKRKGEFYGENDHTSSINLTHAARASLLKVMGTRWSSSCLDIVCQYRQD
jgi:hypothetical protein